jgi:hypothetical protein
MILPLLSAIGLTLDLIGAMFLVFGLFRHGNANRQGWERSPEEVARDGAFGVVGGLFLALVAYKASVTDGQLNWGRGEYLLVDGHVQDIGGDTPRPRPRRVAPTASLTAKRAELDTRIREAADEYRRAIRRGSRSPTADVADALNVGRSTAARAIAAARKQGLLGPARRTAPGEL